MKRTLIAGLCALILGAIPAGAQWGPRTIPEPTDGLKDAYKDYFKIGVAVNNRNVAEPDQIKVRPPSIPLSFTVAGVLPRWNA